MAYPLIIRRLLIDPSRSACAVATGLLLGIAVGILIADGRWWPLIAIVPLGLSLVPLVRALVPREDRARVGAAITLSFALHVAVTVLLYTGSVALGRGGFIPGDDIAYADVSANFVRYLKGEELDPGSGPPYWGGNAYLFGTWVYLESAIFFAIGPEVLVPIVLNGTFALMTALLVFDMTRRLFDPRSAFLALVLTAFYPSLVVWSSLNLKDALALLLVGLCLWSLVRFQQGPRWWPMTLALAVLVPMHSLRPYLYFGLALLVPIVVALTPRLGLAARAQWTAPAVAASAVLLFVMQSGIDLSPQLLRGLEEQRQAMGLTARTRFVEPPPVIVKEGDTFVVASPAPLVPSPSPTDTSPVSPAVMHTAVPAIVRVLPNTRIVVVTSVPAAVPSPGTVHVRPGDVVVVGRPGSTPAPSEQRAVLMPPSSEGVTLRSTETAASEIAIRSVRYLPVGLAFSLFGPFPWLLERSVDLLVLPEMLLWYACLAALAATSARERRRWQLMAPLVLLAVGLLGLFAFVEGNWGTLLRHRAMAIPWTLALAAPSLRRSSRALGVLTALGRLNRLGRAGPSH